MKWISVKNRLPNKEGRYLLFYFGDVIIGDFVNLKNGENVWATVNFDRTSNVTHWQELPKAPKK